MASRGHFIAIKQLENARCGICDTIKVSPVSLMCGHSFCLKCLKRGNDEESADISCSKCERVTTVNAGQQLVPNEELTDLITQMSLIYNCVECDKLTCSNAKCDKCSCPVCMNCQLIHTCGSKQQLCVEHKKPLEVVCTDGDVACCYLCFIIQSHKGHTAALPTDVGNKSVVAKLSQEVEGADELLAKKSGIKEKRDREEAMVGRANQNLNKYQNKLTSINEISFKRREYCKSFMEDSMRKINFVWENLKKNQGESQHNIVSNYIGLFECRDLNKSLRNVKFIPNMENEVRNIDSIMEKLLLGCDKINKISEIPIVFRICTSFTLEEEYETELVSTAQLKFAEVKQIDLMKLGISQIGHMDACGSFVAFIDKAYNSLEVWSHIEGKFKFSYDVQFVDDKCMPPESLMLVRICGDYICVSSAACLWAVSHKLEKVVHHQCLKTAENQVNIVSLEGIGPGSVRVVNEAENAICTFKVPGFELEKKVACQPGKVSTFWQNYALVVNQGKMEFYNADNGSKIGWNPLPCEGGSGILPVSGDGRYLLPGNNYPFYIITTRVGGKLKLNIWNYGNISIAEWMAGIEVAGVAWIGAEKLNGKGDYCNLLTCDLTNNLLRVVKVSLI